MSVYVTDEPPTAGPRPDAGRHRRRSTAPAREVTLDEPATGRFVIVWLTSLPAVDGGFRGEIAEVAVRG